MVDRALDTQPGYLRLAGRGGCRAKDVRELLLALDDSYQAIARVELAAHAALRATRYGPRYRYPPPWWSFPVQLPTDSMPAEQLVVHRVVLESPGFWEFLGTLNPLEVVRKYLNDRHERRKDREYREAAERRQLEIENALTELRVVREVGNLEREFGPDFIPDDFMQRVWASDVREPLERLADFDSRGLIDGGSAEAHVEPPESTDSDSRSGSDDDS